MSVQKNNRTDQLLNIIWKYCQILSEKVIRNNTFYFSEIKPLLDESGILDEIREYDDFDILDNFNIDDIALFYDSFFGDHVQPHLKSNLETEFLRYIQRQNIDYQFYVRCDNFYFSENISSMKIGNSQFFRFSEISPSIQTEIKNVIECDELISAEEKKIYNTYWYLYFRISSIGLNNAIEKAIQKVKTVNAIFKMTFSLNKNESLLLNSRTSPYFYLYTLNNESIFDYGPKLGHRHSLYRITDHSNNLLANINDIIKNPIHELDHAILNVIRLFGLIGELDTVDLKITLVISCLESLLVSQNTDIKSIKYELGEKISFLIESEVEINQYINNTNISKRREYLINRINHFYGIHLRFLTVE